MPTRRLLDSLKVDDLDQFYIFYSSEDRRFETIPELRLWCEVIWRAVYDIQNYLTVRSYRQWNDAINARKWIQSDSRKVGSFFWACEITFPDIADSLIKKIREHTPLNLPPPVYNVIVSSPKRPRIR